MVSLCGEKKENRDDITMGKRYGRRLSARTSVRHASRSSITGRTPSRTSITGTPPSRSKITGRTPRN